MARLNFFIILIYFLFFLILSRLFYWQVVKAEKLANQAQDQYQKLVINQGQRGSIFSSDHHLLVSNQEVYRLFAEPSLIDQNPEKISEQILELILNNLENYQDATQSALKEEIKTKTQNNLIEKLSNQDKKWVSLANKINKETKQKLEKLDIQGLGFEAYFDRFYPEASMAAHVLGFVGKDEAGHDKGYFGIEGALDKELKFKTEKKLIQKIFGLNQEEKNYNGRDVVLTIKREIQFLAEEKLKSALDKYQAQAGEMIIMEVESGKILAMASFPNYDPEKFYKFAAELYKNPSINSIYEPGSVFKVLTVAIGIESQSIQPDTSCTACDGPKKIDKYVIRTWNDQYHPGINMTEALVKSDNTAMIFAVEKIGPENFINYLKKFAFDQKVVPDLQEDFAAEFPDKWGPVELATRSFGQGISVTSLQLVRAVNAIANQGQMVQPQIIEKVIDHHNGQEIITQKQELGQVISSQTAAQVTQMMTKAAYHSGAKRLAAQGYQVAGKTGTAQITNPAGGYYEDKTIASFIGFAPAEKPKFIMLTKLVEPRTSPWGAETAAPLWYDVAEKLRIML